MVTAMVGQGWGKSGRTKVCNQIMSSEVAIDTSIPPRMSRLFAGRDFGVGMAARDVTSPQYGGRDHDAT